MGRPKLTEEQKRLRGNPGKRDIPEEHEVEQASLRCPRGLSKEEKKYWKLWAPPLAEVGKLTVITVPSFLDLIKKQVRLDDVEKFIMENNRSYIQEDAYIDPTGKECKKFKESAYAKMARDLSALLQKLKKTWGLTPDSAGGLFKMKKKTSEEEKFLGG